jgi:hypothetical protein
MTHCVNYTPLNLRDPLLQQNANIGTMQERTTIWQSKSLHGRYACDIETPDVDTVALNSWLKVGELFQKQLDL